MGRGLAAILTSPPTGEPVSELRQLPVEMLRPNPAQPRRDFDRDAIEALAGSMRDRGILQPVLVRPVPGGTYELIAGERRWRAAQVAGLDTVPAIVRPDDDAASLELALIENMVREDLNPVEEARACATLVEELGLKREEIGRRVGRSRVAVSNLLRLLDLPDDALALIESGRLTEGHGRAVLMVGDHDERRRLAREAAINGWSVRQTEARARTLAGAARANRRAPEPHADQVAAAERVGDAFARALGTDVRVTARASGYRVSLSFGSLDEAMAAAARLGTGQPTN
jgi:ParB family chromosome partitioning protein